MAQREKNLTHLIALRLITGYTLLVVSLIGLLGGDWDIEWHAVVGRDRTFTPPHDLILIGIGLAGIVALVSILIETSWARHHTELAQYGTDFLGMVHSSLGSYFVGFGAVCSAVAFPLDTYWHSLYGIDVSLWAPFHTMIYMGGVLSTIGVIYILLSSAHLAQSQGQQRWMRLSYAGVIVALGMLLSKFCTFLTPSLQGHSLNLGFGPINMFPLLLSLCTAFICILAVRVVRWPGTATLTIIAFVVIYLLVNAFVPQMMTWLVQAEHQTYLPRAARLGSRVVSTFGQNPLLLLAGLSIDDIVLLSRRRHWSLSTFNWRLVLVATVSTAIVAVLTLITLGRGQAAGNGHAVVALLFALVFAMLGGFVGSWLGTTIGKTLQEWRS
jgi:hypothetical protein